MITRADIVACARTYLNVPFRHQGRSRIYGVDCVGLPICVARDLGLPVKDHLNYDPEPADDTVLRECKEHLKEVSIEEMKPGDVVCMRVPVPCHTAIITELLGSVGILHAYSPFNKVVEHRMDDKWHRRIAGVFQFPGVED